MEIKAKVRAAGATPASKGKDGKDIPATPATPELNAVATFDMPADLAGMTKAWGDAVVYAAAKNAVVISIQASMRRLMEAKKTPAEISAAVKAFKPDVRNVVKQSAFEKATGAIKSLSAEERANLLKQLTAMK